MEQQLLRLYVREGMRHNNKHIHDWLFEQAQAAGITGGTVFRASAGYGRHGLHEDSFFELAGELPETIEFLADAERIEALLARVGAAGLRLIYTIAAVHTGVTGA